MNAPTAAEIREWSKVDFAALDWAGTDLDILVTRAIEYVQLTTGRELASVPTNMELSFDQAVQMTVEQQSFRSQEDVIETAADFDLIANFSVTGYSETRRSADDAMKLAQKMINPWPQLHALLWALATDDRRDEWLDFWGAQAPAFEVTEVDWSERYLPDYLTWPGA